MDTSIINEFSLYFDNNLIYRDVLNIKYLLDNMDSNTSIVYFENNFSFDNTFFKNLDNDMLQKFIIIGKIKDRPEAKKLFIKNSFSKSFFKNINKIFVVVSVPDEYIECKKLIKNLIELQNICLSLNIEWNHLIDNRNIVGYVIEHQSPYVQDIVNTFNALLLNNKKEKYEFIYDTTCRYLDTQFANNYFCDFKNDQCIANRNKSSVQCDMGCCYSYEYSNFFDPSFIKNIRLCEHFKNKTCSTMCIACKMFTCKELKKNGISFSINNLLLLDCFFNKKQHLILKLNFFKTREQVLDKLLEKSSLPYLNYYLTNKYRIK